MPNGSHGPQRAVTTHISVWSALNTADRTSPTVSRRLGSPRDMADVFISYAREDEEIAEALSRSLEREGFDVWWDRHLIPEADLETIIRRELDACKVVIVVWSASATKSPWVTGEATIAQEQKHLICVNTSTFSVNDLPIRFRALPLTPSSDINKISKALEKFDVRASQIDKRVKELLDEASKHDLFGLPNSTSDAGLVDWDAPAHFAKLIVRLALRDYGFPIAAEADVFTDGMNDLGIDGFAVSVGGHSIIDEESASEVIASYPDAKIRLLFVQAKRDTRVHDKDISYFGTKVQQLLRLPPDRFEMSRPNENIRRQWRLFQDAKSAFAKAGSPIEPEIYLVFAYCGDWQGGHFKPSAAKDTVLDNIRSALPKARASMDIWGTDEIVLAAQRSGTSIRRVIEGDSLLQLPPQVGTAYLGFVSAATLITALSREYRGAIELDPQFFIENPRNFLGLTDAQRNPGASAIQKAITNGNGGRLALGHNGITIICKAASQIDDSKLEVVGPQVVNGCQSCHTLSENRSKLADVFVPLRIVVTSDADIADEVIVASNTQAEINTYNMLSRLPPLKRLQRPFEVGHPNDMQRLWLQRREQEILLNHRGWERVLTPRQLYEAFRAVVLGRPHSATDRYQRRQASVEQEDVFAADHEPNLYRMLGWLVVSGRRWARERDQKQWDDRYYHGGARAYAGRSHFMFALFHLADDTPEHLLTTHLKTSRASQDRFQQTIDKLVTDLGTPFGNNLSLREVAADIVFKAAKRELTADIARTSAFTALVRDELTKYQLK